MFSVSQISLGVFYFGIKIYEIISVYLGNILNQFLIPFFSKTKNITKEREFFFKISKLLCFFVGFLSLIFMIFAPLLINEVWNSKWNDSINIFIVILTAFPIALIGNVLSRNFIEYKREFKSIFLIKICEGICIITFTYIGVSYNGILGAAISISILKIVFSLYQYIKSSQILKIN